MIRRNEKVEFLNALETWMNEIVAKNADGHNERIPEIVRKHFQQSMQASVKYHEDLAIELKDDSDQTLARYHCLMSDIYKTFICR